MADFELLERSGSSLRCNDAPPRRADVGTMQCWHRAPNLNFYPFILIPNFTYSYIVDIANYFIIFTHLYTNALPTHTYFATFITLQKCALEACWMLKFFFWFLSSFVSPRKRHKCLISPFNSRPSVRIPGADRASSTTLQEFWWDVQSSQPLAH